MVAMTTSLILIGHYQAAVGGLYKACPNMVTCHCVVSMLYQANGSYSFIGNE